MNAEAIESLDAFALAAMDNLLLDSSGRLQLWEAAALRNFPPHQLRAWAMMRARYNLPTVELVQWLHNLIGPCEAVEIGAGVGDLGYHLGVTMTDSYVQTETLAAFYTILGQQPTRPLPDVIRQDAETAVMVRRPHTVLASWVTQKYLPGDEHGSVYGPSEEVILANCSRYIFIGNENVHGQKRILSRPHETFKFPWLVSRAAEQSKNVIYIWKGDL